ADLAGFFESGKTKLIMPAVAQGGVSPARDSHASNGSSGSENKGGGTPIGTGGGGSGSGGQDDPLIKALIQKLPAAGAPWAADERINWLKMLVMGFQIAYGTDDEIEITKKEAAN